MILPKHLRPRWRYLAVELETWPDAELTRSAIEHAIDRSARSLFGDAGAARMELRVMRTASHPGRFEVIVRTARSTVSDARAAITCVTSIEGAPVGVRVTGVSGTVRACEEKYLGRAREPMPEHTVAFRGAERSAVGSDALIDVRVEDGYIGATRLDLE